MVAPERLVDYAGQTVPVVDALTGEIRRAQVFVAVLGASNYTYACATWQQTAADWVASIIDTLGFIGGVPWLLVHDQPRALIANPDAYEPVVARLPLGGCALANPGINCPARCACAGRRRLLGSGDAQIRPHGQPACQGGGRGGDCAAARRRGERHAGGDEHLRQLCHRP